MYGLAWFLGAGSRSSVNLDEGILAKRGQNDLCSHRISQSVRQRELVPFVGDSGGTAHRSAIKWCNMLPSSWPCSLP